MAFYRNRTTGEYLLQHNCKHPDGGYADYGIPEQLDSEQFQHNLAELVFQSLEACRTRSPGDLPHSAPRTFERQHDVVFVTLLEDRSVEISAGKRIRGGYEAPIVAIVSEEEARKRMTELIELAFTKTA